MKRLIYISLSFFVITIFSCDSFEQPEVKSVYPSNNMQNVPEDTEVIIKFSKKMDAVKTNEEFTLSSNSGSVEGYFTWTNNNKTMTFRPKENLNRSDIYRIRLSKYAEDKDGNDIKEAVLSKFYLNNDIEPPEILLYSPRNVENPNNSIGVDPDATIEVVFNEPMNIDDIDSLITISPAIEGMFEWNENRSIITFQPRYSIPFGNYRVFVSEAIEDENGNQMGESFSFYFTVGDDFELPTLNVIQPDTAASATDYWDDDAVSPITGIEKDGNIELYFSEIIVKSNLKDAINISPIADYYIEYEDVLVDGEERTTARIIFIQPMKSETYYTLTISTSITDEQNNPLDKKYVYHFYTNGPDSIAPVILSITDLVITEGWALGDVEFLVYNEPTGTDEQYSYRDVSVEFSNSIDTRSLDISIKRVIGEGADGILPEIINHNWPPGNELRIFNFDIYDIAPDCVYELRIKGGSTGLRDLNSNYMAEDFVQYIEF